MKEKKIISLMMTVALAATMNFSVAIPAKAAEQIKESDSHLKLWYDEPASITKSSDTWQEATLPIGNGILGANIYGELGEEHLTLNEETLWSGGRGSVDNYNGGNPSESKVETYNSYANTLLSGGSLYDIEGLAGVGAANSGYYDGYQALGDLYFNFENAPSNTPSDYERVLDLESGLSTVEYSANSVSYTRTYFASNPDNVIVAHLTSVGGKLSFTASLTSQQNGTNTASASDNKGKIECSGTVSNNGLLHNTQVAVVVDSGTVTAENGTIKVEEANEATVYLTAATDYKNTFYNVDQSIEYYYRTGETADQLSARVSSVLDAAVNKGYESVLNDHQEDYKELYCRVSLDLGQGSSKTTDALLAVYKNNTATAEEQRYLEVLMYQYGRYLLIAGSRENSQLPTTLQGIWNNSNNAPWYSDIHTNINEEMNYWLSNSCNLTECAIPLVNYMECLEVPGGKTVEIYTGSEHGIMAHTQNTPYGYTSPGWAISTWGWSPAAATWLLQNCYDYYEYSGDLVTLRDTIYPMLKEQVLMYQDLLQEYNGRLVMPISQSPELSTISAGNTYEQSLIWQLYADTIEAANILGVDKDQIVSWTSTMDKLKPIEIGDSGQVKEWYNETTINSVNDTSSHRHLSNLLGLYPGNLFDTEDEINAAIVSLNNKNFGRVGTTSNNPEGGWTYGQLINSWARVKNGENAYFCINQMLKNRVYDNLWDYHAYGTYGAFQIDGNYGYSAGVSEMLVQSNQGYIDMLPAIPEEWENGSVKGLLCEGNFEIEMNWFDGVLENAVITSGNGGDCSVKIDSNMIVQDSSGNVIASSEADGTVVTFATTAGSKYTIENTSLKVDASRDYNGNIVLTWNNQNDTTYSVKRGEESIASNLSEGIYTDTEADETEVTYIVTGSDGSVATVKAAPVISETASTTTFERVNAATVDDGVYLIIGARPGYSAGKAAEYDRTLDDISTYISGTSVATFDNVENYEWEVKNVSGGYTIQSVSSGSYLQMGNNNVVSASVSDSTVTLQINDASSHFSDAVFIYNSDSGAYLNYRADGGGTAGTWTDGDEGSSWYLYKLTQTSASYAVNEDILVSAAAVGDSSNEAFTTALENAQGSFDSYDAAYKAFAELRDIVNGEMECKHEHTSLANAVDATCKETGYTGDTVCDDCGETIGEGMEIEATGHNYVNGVCTSCGEVEERELVTVSAAKATGNKIALTGKFMDYENVADYNITSHGLIYIATSKLGDGELTVNTSGRSKVTFSSYKSDGSYSYTMKPSGTGTNYTVRAFVTWRDADNNTIYTYSKPIVVSVKSLTQ